MGLKLFVRLLTVGVLLVTTLAVGALIKPAAAAAASASASASCDSASDTDFDGAGETGLVRLVSLGRSGQGQGQGKAELIESGRGDVPGGSGAGDHFGWSIALAGDRSQDAALLIGVPDNRQKVTGSIVVCPFGDGESRLLNPSNIGFPAADLTDFGKSLSSPHS